MRTYNKQKPIVFIHVPKTGGTSLRCIFEEWFGCNFYSHYVDRNKNLAPKVQYLGPESCLFGHFNKDQGLGLDKRYPEIEQFMTILRDPFDTLVSLYYFVKRVGREWPVTPLPLKVSLEEFLIKKQPNIFNQIPYELSLDNYRQIFDQHFVHIGVTERLTDSVSCMAKKLGKPEHKEIPTINVTDRPHDFSPMIRADFRNRNDLAYAIYEYALENYNRE